eukprot:12416229-Karenia_brevis.AAC.1
MAGSDDVNAGLHYLVVKSHLAENSFFPIISCGESRGAPGYGQDVLDSMIQQLDRGMSVDI